MSKRNKNSKLIKNNPLEALINEMEDTLDEDFSNEHFLESILQDSNIEGFYVQVVTTVMSSALKLTELVITHAKGDKKSNDSSPYDTKEKIFALHKESIASIFEGIDSSMDKVNSTVN